LQELYDCFAYDKINETFQMQGDKQVPINNELLKQIPQVDKVMQQKIITSSDVYRHEAAEAVREVLDMLREKIKKGVCKSIPCVEKLAQKAIDLIKTKEQKSMDVRRVINGTGVILHSNLGRATLSIKAAEAIVKTASSYCTLEYDVKQGKRGNRTAGVDKYLKDITGCEASLIVNNNAAAVLLVLSAIARDGDVIVSRSELVEIGGGFRIPDIIELCGCTLKEVGTTNKTRLSDYERAVNKKTKVILKVHSSNFKIVGFIESVSIDDLSALGQKSKIPIFEDIGSGTLVDVKRYGLNNEPLAIESLKNGADIVSFSADKLLGGLQCGIILGREKYISMIKKHPLYRAFRVDKIAIAALEATLRVYKDPITAEKTIPVLNMLSTPPEVIKKRACLICEKINKLGGNAEVLSTKSVAGGGATPGLDLESYAVSPIVNESIDSFENKLRDLPVPIIGRIENNRLIIDIRTVFEEDFDYLAEALAGICGKNK